MSGRRGKERRPSPVQMFTPRRKSRLESGTVHMHLAKNYGGGTNTAKSRAKCPPKPHRPTLLDTVDASSHSLAPLKLPAKARGQAAKDQVPVRAQTAHPTETARQLTNSQCTRPTLGTQQTTQAHHRRLPHFQSRMPRDERGLWSSSNQGPHRGSHGGLVLGKEKRSGGWSPSVSR